MFRQPSFALRMLVRVPAFSRVALLAISRASGISAAVFPQPSAAFISASVHHIYV